MPSTRGAVNCPVKRLRLLLNRERFILLIYAKREPDSLKKNL